MASCRAIQVFEQESEIKAFHARHIAHGHEPRERSRIGVSTSSAAKHLGSLRPTPNNVGHFHVTGNCLHAMVFHRSECSAHAARAELVGASNPPIRWAIGSRTMHAR